METIKIYINLENKEQLNHPFSKNHLNKELVNYLYEECLGHPKQEKIDIHIESKLDFTEEEKEKIRDLIHSYFELEMKENQILKKISLSFHIILLLIGLFCILCSFISHLEFFREIFLILGWLAIWEFASHFIFTESKERIRLKRYKQLSHARIYFDKI